MCCRVALYCDSVPSATYVLPGSTTLAVLLNHSDVVYCYCRMASLSGQVSLKLHWLRQTKSVSGNAPCISDTPAAIALRHALRQVLYQHTAACCRALVAPSYGLIRLIDGPHPQVGTCQGLSVQPSSHWHHGAPCNCPLNSVSWLPQVAGNGVQQALCGPSMSVLLFPSTHHPSTLGNTAVMHCFLVVPCSVMFVGACN